VGKLEYLILSLFCKVSKPVKIIINNLRFSPEKWEIRYLDDDEELNYILGVMRCDRSVGVIQEGRPRIVFAGHKIYPNPLEVTLLREAVVGLYHAKKHPSVTETEKIINALKEENKSHGVIHED